MPDTVAVNEIGSDAQQADWVNTPLLQLALGINKDMVTNGFWPENKGDRNYGEAVALIMTELCVEAKDAIDEEIPFDEKDSVVEEIADAAIRHLDLIAGLGYEIEFAAEVKRVLGKDRFSRPVTLGDLNKYCAMAINAARLMLADSFQPYEEYCTRYVYYPLLLSVELLRRHGSVAGTAFVAENARAFIGIVNLGCIFPGFMDRLLAKVEYNRTRAYRHGKKF